MHTPHADVDTPGYTTFVYYLNSSDGDTVIYNEMKDERTPLYYETDSNLTVYKKITPVYNSIIKFSSNRYHSYFNPVKSERRFVINIVLKLK